jgi:phenylalanyl-tRNA synthetase beta chain
VTLFDVYRGAPLAEGEKSLAHRLTFQAPDRTLTDDEIDAAMAAITTGLREDTGGRPRS